MNFRAQIVLVFLVTFNICSYAQQMVQTPGDILIICQKDEQFIGQPLKSLFQEIKPPIKLVLPEVGLSGRSPHFIFFFTSMPVYQQYRGQGKFPLRLTVFVKEPFEWDWQARFRTREHYLDWTREDEEKYSSLTIAAIRVTGDYNACDYEGGGNL